MWWLAAKVDVLVLAKLVTPTVDFLVFDDIDVSLVAAKIDNLVAAKLDIFVAAANVSQCPCDKYRFLITANIDFS